MAVPSRTRQATIVTLERFIVIEFDRRTSVVAISSVCRRKDLA